MLRDDTDVKSFATRNRRTVYVVECSRVVRETSGRSDVDRDGGVSGAREWLDLTGSTESPDKHKKT